MSESVFTPRFDDLPDELPIFPLPGVLLLPRGILPLNVFEPRYLAMVDEAMRSHRLIGMVQTKDDGSLYDTGCAGRITAYEETPDGRYHISLTGVIRFRIGEELPQKSGFRRATPDWKNFSKDLEPSTCLDVDRDKLTALLAHYFEENGLSCNWEAIQDAPDTRLMTCLAMVCPFDVGEKQALLEAECCSQRARLFMSLLEIATAGCDGDCETKH